MTTANDDDRRLRQAQGNFAFEQMAAASLIGAGVSGLVVALYRLGAALIGGHASFGEFLRALFAGASFSALAFLACFGAASTIGASLFVALERARVRTAFPYYVAALLLGFAAAHFLFGATPSLEAPQNVALLAPGLIATAIFTARMRAYWRLVARQEEIGEPGTLH